MTLKRADNRADKSGMDLPSTGVLLVNALIAGCVVLSVLSILASRLGHACDMHDLRHDCDMLRKQYAERLAALQASFNEDIETEIVGRVSPEQAQSLAA